MNRCDLHVLLTQDLGLVPEPVANPVSRTYFYKAVEWHPAKSTRVVRVLFGPAGEPFRMQLCASSDNNNAVLMTQPFDRQALIDAIHKEISIIQGRLGP